jgi:Icc-related predicted phosphoesterase
MGGLVLVYFVLSLIGSGVAVTLFGSRTYHWKAFDIEVGIQPAAQGETRLIFAPLGEVRARTHRTPVALNIGLRGVSFEEVKRLIASPPPRNELEKDFEQTAQRCLRHLVIWQVFLGAVGALAVPLLLRTRQIRYWFICAIWGGGFVAAIFLSTLKTFDRQAFESPQYTGSLRQADWIITLVKDGFNKVETLSDKLRNVATNINTLYTRINNVPGLAADIDTIRVLHISDVHNNPAAVRFVRDLAEKINVNAVIDTGDLTDFGSPLETGLSRGTALLNVPYLFVAGNHDSQATVAAVRANRNAIVLHDQPVMVAGLTVIGSPDPGSARPGPGSVDTPEASIRAAGEKLLADYRAAPIPPDIACVHNPRQADALVGQAPVILCGHVHRQYVEMKQTTVICNAGTTGAAGARYFEQKQGVPFSACILTFARSPKPRLLFIDQVSLDGSLGQYSISRRTFNGTPTP